MNKYFKYIVLGLGFVITVLLTIGLIVFNKSISNGNITISVDMKRHINNLFGFSEGLVVLNTFITFLFLNNKETNEE